jgi:hypothetical protein
MRFPSLPVALLVLPFLSAGCNCDPGIQRVKPVLGVSPAQLNFGQVKVGDSVELQVKLEAQVNSPVSITGLTLQDGLAPGGASGFQIVEPPDGVPPLAEASFRIRFSPTALQAYAATLVVQSNDEERPEVRVPLSGEGAEPVLAVIPECLATRNCRGTATVTPPGIDFGEEPFQRAVQLPSIELPTVTLVNEGEVQLALTALHIEGPDAAAFKFEQTVVLPHQHQGAPALLLEAREGVNLAIRFKPTSEAQEDYMAEMVVRSDDPQRPEVRVTLVGQLGDNLPPRVCANITRVKPEGEMEIRYDSKAQWDPLLVPPPGGYDFTANRDVRPRAEVRFSAISDVSDTRACTTDPEDQRQNLTYQWTLVGVPPGAESAALTAPHTASPTFVPLATGPYEVQLTVSDQQGHQTSTTLRFVVALKQDLVVQASWSGRMGAYANVDLDLHLVRPSSQPFSYFEEGLNQKTSGDLNGFSWGVYTNNMVQGFDFDWGQQGTFDNPRLNLDDTGGGPLLEIISLNLPENDPACATADCAYGVYVHFFEDRRPSGATCTVDGTCADGEVCDCTGAGERCVANLAPAGTAPAGAGRCLVAPEPVVRIFLKANPVAAAEIPLPTLVPPDELALGAPCHLLHVADVIWPAKDGSGLAAPQVVVRGADPEGRVVAPELTRYGVRAASGLQCNKNAVRGTGSIPDWYAEEPR